MLDQTNQALLLTDLALLVVDARSGITKDDLYLANILRQRLRTEDGMGNTSAATARETASQLAVPDSLKVKKVLVVANKCEK
jgi:hypothetical protein